MSTNYAALVIAEEAAQRLVHARIEESWFDEFRLASEQQDIRRAVVNRVVYLLGVGTDLESRLIVIILGEHGIFRNAASPRHVFDRILHIAMAHFSNYVSIPSQWKPYRDGSRLSLYAQPFNVQQKQRFYVERDSEAGHLFVYALTDDVANFEDVPYPNDLLRYAAQGIVDALTQDSESQDTAQKEEGGSYGIVLEDYVGADLIGEATLEDWRDSKLTAQQRNFVMTPPDRPVRLRGVAGTGKTLCLVIKCLDEVFRAEHERREIRVAFVTHSAGVAHDVVRGMIGALDPEGRTSDLRVASLWVGSLYELAKEKMGYASKGIVPLSLDGAAGRRDQREYLALFIRDCLQDTYFTRSILPSCTDHFRQQLESDPLDGRFLAELMNEVSCVIDPEGIRVGREEKVNSYLNGKRERWQMDLPAKADRRAVLEIYEKYYQFLAESNVISLDQMVADFLRYLDSHEWGYLKSKEGFDLIFVDELHYFNFTERMIFHYLFRNPEQNDGRLPLFMAYDLKQSPDDRFLASSDGGGAGRFFQSIQAGKSELVELTDVFRSTPQIAEFLEVLDGNFPALDLEGEWSEYLGNSEIEGGDRPELRTYDTETQLLDNIVGEAHRAARKLGGRKVAVLCMNDELFERYTNAGRIARKIAVVQSRSDLKELQYAGKRPIFSTPEYVAGLQFDKVYLINVDRADMSEEDSFGAKRRFLSKLYLGASRASVSLVMAACAERGGHAECLDTALNGGALQRIAN